MLTIDVEDWFQVENFKPWIPFSTWGQHELRVERNVHRILDLFDSMKSAGKLEAQSRKANRIESDEARMPGGLEYSEPASLTASQPQAEGRPKATFFILGWIAERLPHLVREIKSKGHEVASHGYNHELCNKIKHSDLKTDLIKSKKLLEDIIGEPIYGYRAPSFSVNGDILKTIKDCGYLYDSSYNSFSLNDRYGKVDLTKYQNNGFAIKLSENFYELPISNLKLSTNPTNSINPKNLQPVKFPSGRNEVNFTGPTNPTNSSNPTNRISFELPLGGGGYFRLIPFHAFKYGVRSILNKGRDYLFYMHPWEIDPEQPRVQEASKRYKFRHYINLNRTYPKLTRLIESFKHCRFVTCKQYIEKRDLNGD